MTAPEGDTPRTSRPPLLEPLTAFAALTACSAALFALGQSVAIVGENLHGLLAIAFLYMPLAASRLSRRPFSYEEAGLRLRPVGRSLGVALGVGGVTWPLFFAAFLSFYGASCDADRPTWLTWWGARFGAPCVGWRGLDGAALTFPPDFALLALTQLLVIAIPEELFFRGYLQRRFEARWPPRRRLLGAPVGLALVVTAGLFALGHLLVGLDPGRLAVFFPGLVFGWMRARTGSIGAGALYHALCNLLSELLYRSFF